MIFYTVTCVSYESIIIMDWGPSSLLTGIQISMFTLHVVIFLSVQNLLTIVLSCHIKELETTLTHWSYGHHQLFSYFQFIFSEWQSIHWTDLEVVGTNVRCRWMCRNRMRLFTVLLKTDWQLVSRWPFTNELVHCFYMVTWAWAELGRNLLYYVSIFSWMAKLPPRNLWLSQKHILIW